MRPTLESSALLRRTISQNYTYFQSCGRFLSPEKMVTDPDWIMDIESTNRRLDDNRSRGYFHEVFGTQWRWEREPSPDLISSPYSEPALFGFDALLLIFWKNEIESYFKSILMNPKRPTWTRIYHWIVQCNRINRESVRRIDVVEGIDAKMDDKTSLNNNNNNNNNIRYTAVRIIQSQMSWKRLRTRVELDTSRIAHSTWTFLIVATSGRFFFKFWGLTSRGEQAASWPTSSAPAMQSFSPT